MSNMTYCYFVSFFGTKKDTKMTEMAMIEVKYPKKIDHIEELNKLVENLQTGKNLTGVVIINFQLLRVEAEK